MKAFYSFVLLCLLIIPSCFGQPSPVFEIKEMPQQGILLDKGWKWQAGDNPEWAKPEFDDSKWESIDPTKDIKDLPQIGQAGIGWFRLRIAIDSSIRGRSLALLVFQVVASEFYINGQFINNFGQVSTNQQKVQALYTLYQPLSFPVNGNREQVIAVRCAIQQNVPYFRRPSQKGCLALQLLEEKQLAGFAPALSFQEGAFIGSFRTGLFFILAFLHLAFFIGYPQQRANLYFAAMAFCFSINDLSSALVSTKLVDSFATSTYLRLLEAPLYPLAYFFLLTALYTIF